MSVEFIEPPLTAVQRSRNHWAYVAAELQAKPNEWAKVGTFSPGVATGIRRGKNPAFLDGAGSIDPQAWMNLHWRVRTSKSENRTKDDVFMKWIP